MGFDLVCRYSMDPARQNVFKKMELFTVCPTERLQAWPVHMFPVPVGLTLCYHWHMTA